MDGMPVHHGASHVFIDFITGNCSRGINCVMDSSILSDPTK